MQVWVKQCKDCDVFRDMPCEHCVDYLTKHEKRFKELHEKFEALKIKFKQLEKRASEMRRMSIERGV